MRINLSDAEKIKLYLSQTDTEPPPPRNAKASEIAKVRKDYDTIDLVKLGIKEDTASASRKALIDGIIRPRLKEIFVLIAEKLKTANLIGQTPAGIVITGGGAQTVQILDTAKRTLALPARIGIPKGLTGLVDELGSPAFATSAGLILYGSRQNVKHTSSFKTPNFMGAIGKVPVRGVYDKAIALLNRSCLNTYNFSCLMLQCTRAQH
jgi:cell division ATPase FtsA